jgi:predicted  nucleic acid-binding Zn-ribbon protein
VSKACRHDEEFVACDKCDLDNARAEILSLESELADANANTDAANKNLSDALSKLDAVIAERDRLAAREAVFISHDCNEGCAVAEAENAKGEYAYSKEGDAFVEKYYALKKERDDLASRLDACQSSREWLQQQNEVEQKAAREFKAERDALSARLDAVWNALTEEGEPLGVCQTNALNLLRERVVESQRHLTKDEQDGMHRALLNSTETE